MKRLILSAVLAAAALGMTSGPALAGGPFSCNSCNPCGATFCVRQYNAFSPVCSGLVYCDGIVPFGGPGFPSCCGGVNPPAIHPAHAAGCVSPSCMAGGPAIPGYPGHPPTGFPGHPPTGFPGHPPAGTPGLPMLPPPRGPVPGPGGMMQLPGQPQNLPPGWGAIAVPLPLPQGQPNPWGAQPVPGFNPYAAPQGGLSGPQPGPGGPIGMYPGPMPPPGVPVLPAGMQPGPGGPTYPGFPGMAPGMPPYGPAPAGPWGQR